MNGIIDEVRIYNRALGATEIAALAKSGAAKFTSSSVELQRGSTLANGLVGHWTFDGPDVTDKVYDRSGQGNNGYFIGGATSSAKKIGKLGQALDFDGSGAAVVAPQNDLTTFTISAWIKSESADLDSSNHALVVRGSSSFQPNYFAGVQNGIAYTGFHTGSFTYPSVAQPSQTMAAGNWYHVVGTYNTAAGGTLTIYVDGVQSNQSTGNGTPEPGGTQIFSIGGIAAEGGEYFNGAIDDVRVYNRALTAARHHSPMI